jgi:hypothetical protein
MAEFRKIVKSNPISNFRNYQPSGGTAFGALADAMSVGYNMLLPAAKQEMETMGAEVGMEMARRNIGAPQKFGHVARVSSKGGDMAAYRDAIASIESKGSGDYAAVGPRHKTLGRALGRYQVMEANIGPWSKAALGREVSADEFLSNPDIQDAVFDHRFGGYVEKYGADNAAQAWFAGEGGIGRMGRKDSLGTSVSTYTDKFRKALGNAQRLSISSKGKLDAGGTVADGTADPQVQAPVMVMTAEGKTEPRLFSPLSGPLLQIHNAAAGAAYLAEVENQSLTQMMDLSAQFAGNPAGFQQAMEGMISEAVKAAPSMFRGDVRKTLTGLAQRRILGMHEDQQRDTRQRAANSNGALVERYGDELTTAILSGDEATIAAAQAQLEGALRLRETLPGLAWTPEQSQNAITKAQQRAASEMGKARESASRTASKTLKDMVKTFKSNLTHADEGMLEALIAESGDEELGREAMAWYAIREGRPEVFKMTPDELDALVAELNASPVDSEFQIDTRKAIEDMAKDQRKGFRDDPIARAQEVLPGAVPDLDISSPEAMGISMDNRVNAALALAGIDENRERTLPRYTNEVALLSKEEAAQVKQLLGPEMDAGTRLAYTAEIVKAMGADSPLFFKQAGVDPVLAMGAMLQANGGDEALAIQALRGQEMLAAGLVMTPTKATTLAQISPEIQKATSHIPVDDQKAVMDFAKAIYASQAQGIDHTSDAAKDLLQNSIQKALGQQTDVRGVLTGGVQKIGGQYSVLRGHSGKGIETLLPVGVGAREATETLKTALLGYDDSQFQMLWGREAEITARRAEIWAAAGASSAPMIGGKPLDPRLLDLGQIRLVPDPRAKNSYVMMIDTGSSITDVRDASGKAFTFDLVKLIEARK